MQQLFLSTVNFDKMVHRINKQSSLEVLKCKAKITNYIKYRQGNRSPTKIVNSIQNKRFQKHNNLIETNRSHFTQTANSTVNSRYKNRDLNLPCKENLFPCKNTLQLNPKTKNHFFSHFSERIDQLQTFQLITSQNLQSILMKNRLKNHRNLLGYNILRLQKKYHFSRFQLHNLYSMYHTLLKDSKGDIKRFKSGFEVILNMIKIAIRPEILQSIFIEQQKLDFQNFIEMYSKIDQAIYKQSIIDYIQILFEGIYNKQKIRYDDIVRIMKSRITQKQSQDIAKIIFQQLERRTELTVSISEIYGLCNACQTFAMKMFRLYTGQIQ